METVDNLAAPAQKITSAARKSGYQVDRKVNRSFKLLIRRSPGAFWDPFWPAFRLSWKTPPITFNKATVPSSMRRVSTLWLPFGKNDNPSFFRKVLFRQDKVGTERPFQEHPIAKVWLLVPAQ